MSAGDCQLFFSVFYERWRFVAGYSELVAVATLVVKALGFIPRRGPVEQQAGRLPMCVAMGSSEQPGQLFGRDSLQSGR